MDNEIFTQLQEWNELLKNGVITQEEFNKKKAEILQGTTTSKEEDNNLNELNSVSPSPQTIQMETGLFNKQKKKIWILVSAITLLVVLVCGIIFFIKQKNNKHVQMEVQDISLENIKTQEEKKNEPPPPSPPQSTTADTAVATSNYSNQYQLAFYEDFSSRAQVENNFIFTVPNWGSQQHTTAHTIRNNCLEIRVDETDANSSAVIKKNFGAANQIKLIYEQYMHEGWKGETNFGCCDFYMPGVQLATYSNLINLQSDAVSRVSVRFQVDNYNPDIHCGNPHRPEITYFRKGSETFCANNFTRKNSLNSAESNSFYDKWIVTIIELNKSSGHITVDIDGDGLIDMEGDLPVTVTSDINTISFSTAGWYTGHSLKIKNLKVYTQ